MNASDKGMMSKDKTLKRISWNNFFSIVNKCRTEIVEEFMPSSQQNPNQKAYNKVNLLAGAALSVMSDSADEILTKIHREKSNKVSDHKGRVTYVALYCSRLQQAVQKPDTIEFWKANTAICDKIFGELKDLTVALGTVGVEDVVCEVKETKKTLKTALNIV